MTIKAVKHQQKQIAFLSLDGKSAVAFPDPASPIAQDFEVTVTDTADVTKDGYVVRGNKLKVGNIVELEGFKYRAQGVVSDIRQSE
jgi:translation elongation factor EF-Tu-like GTPase